MHPKRPAPPSLIPLAPPPPAPKRLRCSTPQGGGVVGQAAAAAAGKQGQLWSSVLPLFFIVRVKGELRCNRRLRRVIREENAIFLKKAVEMLENVFQKHLYQINVSMEALSKRIDVLSYEVVQIKHSNPNHYAYEHCRSKVTQEHAVVVAEANEEQTAAVDGLIMNEARKGAGVQLRFLNCSKSLVYTERKITAEDGMAIKIAIYRENQIITSGPLSSARIEILALHGDFSDVVPDNWTQYEFDKRRVSSRQGPVLGGDCQVRLKNGEASLGDICFKIVSSKTESGKLILAARIHESDKAGLRVKEAVMNPVVVQVSRNESNGKSNRPKLKDEVCRLKGISKKGDPLKRLQESNIRTVEDFLKALNKNEEKILEYFNRKRDSKHWEATVKHAKECDLEGNCKLKSYMFDEENVVLFFNCVHDLVGANFHSCYRAKDNFNLAQQHAVNRYKKRAYDELDRIEFSHEMKDSYPIPLCTTTNTSIGDEAPFPSTGTAGPYPPDHHTTPQVEGTVVADVVNHGQSYHTHELPNAFPDIGADPELTPGEQHCTHGYQGNQASGLTQMAHKFPQVDTAVMGYIDEPTDTPLLIDAGNCSGGNNSNLIGTKNAAQDVMDSGFEGLLLEPMDYSQFDMEDDPFLLP